MSLFNFPHREAMALLQALKTVAIADGEFARREQATLLSAAEMLGVDVDIVELPSITPDELAGQLPGRARRLVTVKACLVMAIVDGTISPEEWQVLTEYRAALSISDSEMEVFHSLSSRQRQLNQFEFQRRFAAPQLRTMYAEQGWEGVMQFFSDLDHVQVPAQTQENPELVWRYRKLGLLPEGTLGRELWKFYRTREFAFAGEIGGVPEHLVAHDITHVLTGYSTDPDGELEVLAFTAGMRDEDPFSALFLVLLQFDAGLKVIPGGRPRMARELFDQARVLRALSRGQAATVDLAASWDYWEEIDMPVEILCERYGIERR
ncbi:MAG: TerB family tellurite resistance protein [Myxococcales bacterium]|nr:TerB family tellurite resistance protein [Myxococcales bacterium]